MPAKPKRDPAVERLVRQGYAALYLAGVNEQEARRCIEGLIQDTYNFGRQSAARECAEIADRAVISSGVTLAGKAIRERFCLEAK